MTFWMIAGLRWIGATFIAFVSAFFMGLVLVILVVPKGDDSPAYGLLLIGIVLAIASLLVPLSLAWTSEALEARMQQRRTRWGAIAVRTAVGALGLFAVVAVWGSANGIPEQASNWVLLRFASYAAAILGTYYALRVRRRTNKDL